MSLIVTLIHGTFAPHAVWVEPHGAIGSAITQRFGNAVSLETFRWSGRNSFEARFEAAEKLRAHILRDRPGRPGARHVLVAHSHAGNVVTYAARDPEVNRRIAGAITLATPFILARHRNLGWTGLLAPQALVLWLTLALLYFLPHKTVAIIAAVLLIEIPGLLLAARWARSSQAFLDRLSHGVLEKQRLLILRAVADEATDTITFFRFPSLTATLLLGNIARLSDRVVLWYERLVKRPLRALGFCLFAWVLAFVAGYLIALLTGSLMLSTTAILLGACLGYGPLIFLWLRNRHLAFVTAAGPIALLAAPFILGVAIALLPFGLRFAIANLFLDVSVESSPIGEYEIVLFSPASLENPDTPGGLWHSALYNDPAVARRICDFLATLET